MSLVFCNDAISSDTFYKKLLTPKQLSNEPGISNTTLSSGTFVDNSGFSDYGQIAYSFSLNKLSYADNERSDLYFLIVDADFEPGAFLHNDTFFSHFKNDALNYKGELNETLKFSYAASPTYSADLTSTTGYYNVIEYLPKGNNYQTISVNSSFSLDYNFGYSEEDGFYAGGNLIIGYSSSVSRSNPTFNSGAISVDSGNTIINGSDYKYTYSPSTADVYHVKSVLIFEMIKLTNLQVEADIFTQMDTYQDHFWNTEQEVYSVGGQTKKIYYKQ